jgi:hypothetical protein
MGCGQLCGRPVLAKLQSAHFISIRHPFCTARRLFGMADQEYAEGWGLGRHVFGSNYFHYVRDPWGSYCKYSCEMDYIPAGSEWDGGDHGGEDAFYIWGPTPPADFAVHKEMRD